MKLSVIETALAERILKLEERIQILENNFSNYVSSVEKKPSVDLNFLDRADFKILDTE